MCKGAEKSTASLQIVTLVPHHKTHRFRVIGISKTVQEVMVGSVHVVVCVCPTNGDAGESDMHVW